MTTNHKENYKFVHHTFLRACDTALHLLQKAEDFAKEKPVKSEAELQIMEARLAPDMFNFKKQIQVFSDNACGGIARAAGLAKPSLPDTETTLDELIKRVQVAKDFIKSVDPDKIEGIENVKIKLPWMPEGMYFEAPTYMSNFVIQNTLFHLSIAYAILRHLGVQIGKTDYLGQVEMKNE